MRLSLFHVPHILFLLSYFVFRPIFIFYRLMSFCRMVASSCSAHNGRPTSTSISPPWSPSSSPCRSIREEFSHQGGGGFQGWTFFTVWGAGQGKAKNLWGGEGRAGLGKGLNLQGRAPTVNFAPPLPCSFDHFCGSSRVQCPAGRVFQCRVRSGRVVDKIPGSRSGSGRLGVSLYTIGYFRVSISISGISGYFRYFWVCGIFLG